MNRFGDALICRWAREEHARQEKRLRAFEAYLLATNDYLVATKIRWQMLSKREPQ